METCDFLAIGGGIAGLMAANRAAELGLSAIVLEKGEDESYLCNTRYTGGAFHLCFRDSSIAPPEEMEEAIMAVTQGTANRPLVAAITRNAARLIPWLRAEGIQFIKASPAEYHNKVLAPPRPNQAGLHWKGRSGDVFLRTMSANLERRGGQLRRGARATGLEPAADGILVHFVQGGREQVISAGAVVLADGGIQGNLELLGRHVTRHPERLFQRGAATGTGDGLQMAEKLGAASTGLENFYGHLLSRDVLTRPGLWPYPQLDALATAGIVVGADGRRFVDEGEGGVFIANALARLDDPQSATIVFDDAAWRGPGAAGLVAPNPNLTNAGGTLVTAGSIVELAAKLSMPADALAATVGAYNAAMDGGEAMSPTRRRDLHAPLPIRVAPFHATPICPGITYSMGGIVIDAEARVLRADGSIIPGLFAAGTTTGGVEGGPAVGYAGGLVRSAVTALLAAESAAATRPQAT